MTFNADINLKLIVMNLLALESYVTIMGEPQPSTSALPTASKPQLECSSSKAFNKNLFPRDFSLILKGDYRVPVSSEVLCLNSSVFTKIIRDLKLTSHEMDDFEYDAVEKKKKNCN